MLTLVASMVLVAVGGALMALAVRQTTILRSALATAHARTVRAWRALHVLMAGFLAGYVWFFGLLLTSDGDLQELLTAGIFFAGAAFVLGVVRVTRRTIGEVTEAQESAAQSAVMRDRAQDERDEALRASRQKSTFLANMSHELRTPLNAIIGYSEMVEEALEPQTQPELVADVQRVQAAGRHLLALIDDVLDHARVESGSLRIMVEEVDGDGLIQEIMATAIPLARDGSNSLTLHQPAPLGSVRLDPLRFKQCALNLLANACKFTTEGRVELHVGSVGHLVRLIVRDTGVGIAKENLARIFEAFQQADESTTRQFGGTGLGLTLTRQLVERMGGALTVESVEGEGSSFTIELPVRADALAVG